MYVSKYSNIIYIIQMLSAMVSSANRVEKKKQKLLGAGRRSEVQLGSVRRTYCTAIAFTITTIRC